jgi:transcriptional regulator with XRE-family HTH domain
MTNASETMSEPTIGSALAKRRGTLKLSRVQAADQIGMSRTTYSSYERDSQRPSVDVFPVLAGFLDVSMDDFLALYGATSIAAVRPSLERLLKERANPTTVGEPAPTPAVIALAPLPSAAEPIGSMSTVDKPLAHDHVKSSKGKKKKKGKRAKG